MSLSKINNFANDDTDILAVQTTVDALYQNSYSLTEYDSTTVPAIAAGSKIEVNGSLYRAAEEEAISTTDPVTSTTVADGTVYICMIPSVDASTCTAAFTATAPTWSDSKQGYYGTGGQANYKYIAACYKSSTSYYGKRVLNNKQLNIIHVEGGISADVTSYTAFTAFPFNSIRANMGGCYVSNVFYVPISGVYSVNIMLRRYNTTATEYIYIGIGRNALPYYMHNIYPIYYTDTYKFLPCCFNQHIYLDAGEYIYPVASAATANNYYDATVSGGQYIQNSFSITLIEAAY